MADHGTRTRYIGGCRCEPCTVANRLYARERERRQARIRYGIEQPPPERHTDATEARQHLAWLRTKGIGLRTVAARTGLSRTTVQQIASGQRTQALTTTVDRILAVNAARVPDATIVDGTRTLQQIAELVAAGHTRVSIAERLGNKRALQYRKPRVTDRTRRKVEVLHKALTERTR